MATSIHYDNLSFVPFSTKQALASCSKTIGELEGVDTYLVGAPSTPYVQNGFMSTLREQYPEMVTRYLKKCGRGEVVVGDVVVMQPRPNPKQVQFLFCALHTTSKDAPTERALQRC